MNSAFNQAVQEVLSRTSIVELIGADVRLQKKGTNYLGLCPFHQEKTPSFTVSEPKNYYHCFGCGAHGNAINYMMNRHNYSFKDAITLLADKSNVHLPEFSNKALTQAQQDVQQEKQREYKDQKQQIIEVHRLAAEYYHVALLKKREGDNARKYLQKRQVSPQTIVQFQIGYADGGLTKYLMSLGYSEELLLSAGVALREDQTKRIRDRFINRLMFPILDIRNRPIAFGGRTLDDSNPNIPKYLNSQDTPIFHKGSNLYNLNTAIKYIKEKGIVLVEGYMDVIAMVSYGFPQAVASLGTALTETQIEVLWKYCERPVLCFDGDNAGVRASIRVVRRVLPILKPGKTLFFCYLPKDLDPDELLKTQGANAMQEHLDNTSSLADVLWRDMVSVYEQKNSNRDTWIPEDKAALKRDILNVTTLIKDPDIQNLYKQLFLEKFNLMQKRPQQKGLLKPVPAVARLSPQSKPQKILGQKILLGILLEKPVLLSDVDELLSMMDFVNSELSEIKDWLLDVSVSDINYAEPTFLERCAAFLEKIGKDTLKVHAPFVFDLDASTEFILKRWKEIWFCTEGYSMIKGDFRRMGNALKQNFDEKSWNQMRALFSSIDYFDKDLM
ncbi:MAG: DNA primase [Holosporales bacterium]|jgi:DNA primase|nr:DNA primase [Holosporales bacterium]